MAIALCLGMGAKAVYNLTRGARHGELVRVLVQELAEDPAIVLGTLILLRGGWHAKHVPPPRGDYWLGVWAKAIALIAVSFAVYCEVLGLLGLPL